MREWRMFACSFSGSVTSKTPTHYDFFFFFFSFFTLLFSCFFCFLFFLSKWTFLVQQDWNSLIGLLCKIVANLCMLRSSSKKKKIEKLVLIECSYLQLYERGYFVRILWEKRGAVDRQKFSWTIKNVIVSLAASDTKNQTQSFKQIYKKTKASPYFDTSCKTTHCSHCITYLCCTESAPSLVTFSKKSLAAADFSAEQGMSKGQWEGGLWRVIKSNLKEKGDQQKKIEKNTKVKAQGRLVGNKENCTWVGND